MWSCSFRVAHAFEMVTLSDQLICAADSEEELLGHLVHILKVNLISVTWVLAIIT